MILAKVQLTKVRSGFTLIELLVVMAALMVLAAVTLPSIKGLLHNQKVTSASRMVKAHVEAAQARAIASGRPVAVILERTSADLPNMVTRLSIGQVFPPYEGDIAGTLGTLADSNGDGFFDQITIPLGAASLLNTVAPAAPIFSTGDFIQIDDRQSTFVIESVGLNNGLITFRNPNYAGIGGLVTQEGQLPLRNNVQSRFRLYRKPTKSFLQPIVLPRGTCVDLSVSGLGLSGNEFYSAAIDPAMIVFDSQGRIAYWTNGLGLPSTAGSLIHLLIGRTEQVSLSTPPMEVENPDDSGTFNANINDNSNSWLTINPFTGAITSSGLQAGAESATFAARLAVARAFATHAVTQSEN